MAEFSHLPGVLLRSAPTRISAFALTAALATMLVSATAAAAPTGIAGYSGKAGVTIICNQCHNGGTAPAVQIDGPRTLTAGQVGQYKFRVETVAQAAGAGIAATDGVKLTAGAGLHVVGTNELGHTAPLKPTAGVSEFLFSVEAPATTGIITLWAAGNAVNLNGNPDGDLAAGTLIQVSVTGGTVAADAGASPAGGAGDASAGTSPQSGPTAAGSAEGPGAGADGGPKPYFLRSADEGDPKFADTGLSCAVGPGRGASGAAGLALVCAAGLLVARRRRSP